MKLLITGAKGQLGTELVRCLSTMRAEIGTIPFCYKNANIDAVDCDVLDIADAVSLSRWLHAHDPYDIVFNCAAITNVDGCELDEAGAYRVNAAGAEFLSSACDVWGTKIVHVSTDYVFSGTEQGDRVESDLPNPTSAYGRTKLAGEQLVAKANNRHFIVRTAWLYGYKGNNFVKTMQRLGTTQREVRVVDDQIGNPTSANDLAYELLRIAATENYGIYHCTNNGTCSWAEFAQAIMEGSNLDCTVVPVTSKQYKKENPASAIRPAYSGLRNAYLEATIGDEMRPWEEALACFLRNQPLLDA